MIASVDTEKKDYFCIFRYIFTI